MAERPHTVRAAGGVLWRPARDGVEVAVVHRPRYDDWSLPKGKLEPGEPAVAGAVREVREETGFDAVVGRSLGTSRYAVVHAGREVPKTVRWWAMRCTGGRFEPSGEVDALRWVPATLAASVLTRAAEAVPVEGLLSRPVDTRPVVLLRHGRAGSRAQWTGDDDARPLDEVGRAQAEAAARVLPLYGVRRVLSAPLERCTATVRPLAERLGVVVEPHDALSARGWAADPDATRALVRALAAAGTPVVACTQGEVVPGLVRRLTAGTAAEVAEPSAPKGSAWVLSFGPDAELAGADHVPDLAE